MKMDDLRYDGRAGRFGAIMTAVVVDGPNGKEYRRATDHEVEVANVSMADVEALYADVPFGLPTEPTPKGGGGAARAFSVAGYGLLMGRSFYPAPGARFGHVCASPFAECRELWQKPVIPKNGEKQFGLCWLWSMIALQIMEAQYVAG